jgi:hypothetical protein
MVQNAFVSIAKDMGFHVSHEQTHVLPPPSLQSFCEWVDIMLSIDGIHTLANVVIVDPTTVDLVFQTASFHGVVTTMVTQAKEGFYHDRHPTYMFIPPLP